MAVREVLEVSDAGDLPGLVQLLQLADDPFGSNEVRQLGDHNGLTAPADVLDVGPGTDPDRAAASLVGIPDSVVHDDPAAGEVRAR